MPSGQTEVTLQDTAMGPLRRKSSKRRGSRVFPGCPVVKTSHFQCRVRVRSLVMELRSHILCSTAKKRGRAPDGTKVIPSSQNTGQRYSQPHSNLCSDILVKQLGIRELKKLHRLRAEALRAQANSCVGSPLGE